MLRKRLITIIPYRVSPTKLLPLYIGRNLMLLNVQILMEFMTNKKGRGIGAVDKIIGFLLGE